MPSMSVMASSSSPGPRGQASLAPGRGRLDSCGSPAYLAASFGTPKIRVLTAGTRLRPARVARIARGSLMKFRPLHDRVVVRRIDAEEKTKGGIIIPDTAKEKPQEGEIVAAGPGARDESGKLVPLDVKAGDRILFGKWSGTEVRIDGEDLLIMKEADVMGVVEGVVALKRKAA